jgi:hypothetical protein
MRRALPWGCEMTVQPLSIVTGTAPSAGVISILEAALESARSGELRSVVVVGTCVDGSVYDAWALGKGTPFYALLGGVEMCKTRLIENQELR